MKYSNWKGAVLELICRPHVQGDVDNAGAERSNVWNEDKYVTNQLRVRSPGDRVKNAGNRNNQVDSCRVFRLKNAFHAFENENVLAHATSRGNESVEEGVC